MFLKVYGTLFYLIFTDESLRHIQTKTVLFFNVQKVKRIALLNLSIFESAVPVMQNSRQHRKYLSVTTAGGAVYEPSSATVCRLSRARAASSCTWQSFHQTKRPIVLLTGLISRLGERSPFDPFSTVNIAYLIFCVFVLYLQ